MISEAARKKMMNYSWPGNVRELQHAIERAVIMSSSHILNPDDFFFSPSIQDKDKSGIHLEDFHLEEVEKILIRKVLQKYQGNITQAANELGLTRSSLYRRLEKYGL
jgi:DNA-binding NtrC family response regulator